MEKKLITINTSGPINELAGGIWGPVLTPTQISTRTIYKMVANGKKVYEVNPRNRKQTILLTKDNYKKDNFNLTITPDLTPKFAEEARLKEEARLAAIAAQEEAERIAKEEAEKAATIVQEDDPDVIPIHDNSEESTVSTYTEPESDTVREASTVEGFDISRSNKKNKKHGDFRK